MKIIVLGGGQEAMMDDEDFYKVKGPAWRKTVEGHARATIKGKQILMHRLILNLYNPLVVVNHINGNRLDNRKSNLELVVKGATGAKGIRITDNGKYTPYAYIKKRYVSWGRFNTIEEAQRVLSAMLTPYTAARESDTH